MAIETQCTIIMLLLNFCVLLNSWEIRSGELAATVVHNDKGSTSATHDAKCREKSVFVHPKVLLLDVATMNTKLQNFYYVLQETGRWLAGSVICGFSHCCCSKYHDFNFSWAGMGHY